MTAVAYAVGHLAVLAAFVAVGVVVDWVSRAVAAHARDRGWWS